MDKLLRFLLIFGFVVLINCKGGGGGGGFSGGVYGSGGSGSGKDGKSHSFRTKEGDSIYIISC